MNIKTLTHKRFTGVRTIIDVLEENPTEIIAYQISRPVIKHNGKVTYVEGEKDVKYTFYLRDWRVLK